MSSLKDKNIIVTGASGGIGNSIVEKLNQNGAPFWFNFSTIELPIPPEAPVTIIFLSFKLLIDIN